MADFVEAIKGYGGYVNSVTTIGVAIVAWWKGLPALLEAGAKLFEIWSNRAASIEDRLNASVAAQFQRYDLVIAGLERHVKECDDDRAVLRDRIRILEDDAFVQKQEMTGLRRQLVAYEASGDRLPPDNNGATMLPPRTPA